MPPKNPFQLFGQQQQPMLGEPVRPMTPTGAAAPAQAQSPWAAILALLGQHQQQSTPMDHAQADVTRLQGLRNDPQGDANKGYAPGANNAHNPFSNGFFNQSAGNLDSVDPRIMQSQGATAMNQWASPGQFQWNAPQPGTNAQNAMNASPAPFQISPESSALAHGLPPPGMGPFGPLGGMQVGPPGQRPPVQKQQQPLVGFNASANPRPGFGFNLLR